jgi:ATP-binding protein involved in chromosome partitioning
MPTKIEVAVAEALAGLRNPRVDQDVVSAGMVRDLVVEADGLVSLTFLLSREDPATLVREVRRAIRGVDGVKDVKIEVEETGARSAGAAEGAGGAPGPRPRPPEPVELPELGAVLAISSGKGGVGKSTVAANLAVALAREGRAVALMDADIYGPNIPRLFGVSDKPFVRGGKIVPLTRYGVKLISLGLLVERDAPAIWRGPIVTKIIGQFLRDVEWGKLDYFLVDLPPGTGDAQLSLAQMVHVRGAIIVTTPQEMAVGDALRGARMFERVGVSVVGVVENMSYFACPHCGERSEIFVSGGGKRLADELGVPLLGQVPLQAEMAAMADQGEPVVIAQPDSPAGRALREVAQEVAKRAVGKSISLPIITG